MGCKIDYLNIFFGIIFFLLGDLCLYFAVSGEEMNWIFAFLTFVMWFAGTCALFGKRDEEEELEGDLMESEELNPSVDLETGAT